MSKRKEKKRKEKKRKEITKTREIKKSCLDVFSIFSFSFFGKIRTADQQFWLFLCTLHLKQLGQPQSTGRPCQCVFPVPAVLLYRCKYRWFLSAYLVGCVALARCRGGLAAGINRYPAVVTETASLSPAGRTQPCLRRTANRLISRW